MLAIYCRVSKSKEEGKDTSIPTQKKLGLKLADELGLEPLFFIDEGISGTKGEIEDRPEFARMIRAIKDSEVSAVYTQYQDRLERNELIWHLFVAAMLKADCKFYPQGKLFDLNNPQNQFIASVMSANNALYASLTSQRVKHSIKLRAEQGKFRGLAAYGYEYDDNSKLIINEQEAEVVRRIFDLSLSGVGTYRIANLLNEDEIPTRYNQFKGNIKKKDPYTKKITAHKKGSVRWRGNVIHDMIRNPIYKGKKKLKDKFYDIEAIVSPEHWEKVNKNLKENKKNVGKKARYKYLLNGLIECADCGRQFVGKKRIASNDNSYKCKGKIYPHPICESSRGININKLDSFIIKHLFKSKDLKDRLLKLPPKEDNYQVVLKELEKEKKELEQMNKELNLAYKRLLNPDFAGDEFIENHVSELKKLIEKKEIVVKKLESEVLLSEHSNQIKRTKKLISDYVDGAEFKDVKRLVHSLIEYIKIGHIKEEGKMGNFILEIKYKGYDETSIFLTNWTALSWTSLSRYRNEAISNDDIKDDTALMNYLIESKKESFESIDDWNDFKAKAMKDFKGFETLEGLSLEPLELLEGDMVYFDK